MTWLGLTSLQPGAKSLSKIDAELQRRWRAIGNAAASDTATYEKATFYVREVHALDTLAAPRLNAQGLQTLMCSHDAVATELITPAFPPPAAAADAQGTAQIKVTTDELGRVVAASVYKSTQNATLDNVALQAAEHAQYAPRVANCQNVGASFLYETTFTMKRVYDPSLRN
jgi:TonB family protein